MISMSKTMLSGKRSFGKEKGVLSGGYVNSQASEEVKNSVGDNIVNLASAQGGVGSEFIHDAFKINPWIRAVVGKILNRLNQVSIYPQPMDIGGEAPKKATRKQKRRIGELNDLFSKPNDQNETFNSIKSKVFSDLLLYSNAGMEVNKVGDDKFELYCNAPGFELYPYVGKNGKFVSPNSEAYVQLRMRKKVAKFGVNELLYFATDIFAGKVRGMSKIESIALQISADLFSDKYNIDFFSNNARPNIAFLFENLGFGKGAVALRRAKEWYISEHQGKPHLPLFMGTERGEVKLQQLQMTNKDMEFQAYQQFLLSKIMAVYGMQPIILGFVTDTTGKLNSEEQVAQFKIDAVLPHLVLFCDVMNLVLVRNNFQYDDVFLTFDDLDLKDAKDTSEMYQTYLKNGVITINQVRQELQMAPVPWGDVPYIPVNIAPLGGQEGDRMDQNPAAAQNVNQDGTTGKKSFGEIEKIYKEYATLESVCKAAGLQYVSKSRIEKAVGNMLDVRVKELEKKYFYYSDLYKNDSDEKVSDTNNIGTLKKNRMK